MAKHYTYFLSEDAKAQAEFYVEALGGQIDSVQTHGELPGGKEEWKDKVIHLSVTVAGITFLMSDAVLEPETKGTFICQTLEFKTDEEAHKAFDNLAKGGQVLDSLKPAFWGALFGLLEDKFGVRWMITTEAPTPTA
ncbi:VOC family protein [Gorillibacterium massiliense]|uniref:VOC family protein n=1 Tax=Gorillibacterium massiliense TaxID=1280390 RepID=UPI0004B1E79F|nr:glyoxalase/bleomycin resistance/extradiol dioxygenase family protein [Gorillibacterium massiliense]